MKLFCSWNKFSSVSIKIYLECNDRYRANICTTDLFPGLQDGKQQSGWMLQFPERSIGGGPNYWQVAWIFSQWPKFFVVLLLQNIVSQSFFVQMHLCCQHSSLVHFIQMLNSFMWMCQVGHNKVSVLNIHWCHSSSLNSKSVKLRQYIWYILSQMICNVLLFTVIEAESFGETCSLNLGWWISKPLIQSLLFLKLRWPLEKVTCSTGSQSQLECTCNTSFFFVKFKIPSIHSVFETEIYEPYFIWPVIGVIDEDQTGFLSSSLHWVHKSNKRHHYFTVIKQVALVCSSRNCIILL